MDSSWIVLLLICVPITSPVTVQQTQNCSKLLCPTRESECASLDQVSKCGVNSMILRGISNMPIRVQNDELSGLVALKASEDNDITFEKAAPLWSILGKVNITTLLINNFCYRKGSANYGIFCDTIDPKFQSINIDYFVTMNSVQNVIFTRNCARDFIGNLKEKFPEIVDVNLEDNFLAEVPTMLRNATKLRSLSLSANNINTLKDDDFDRNFLIQDLNLGKNCLHDLPPSLLSRLSHLETLILSDNYLETIPESLLSNNKNLRLFSVDYNNVKTLPSNLFHNTPKIKEMSFKNNQISSIPEDLLINCDQLENLYLNGNQLYTLPLHAFRSTTNLKNLYLFGNNFNEIPIIKFGAIGVGGPASIDLGSNNINIVQGPIINRIPQAKMLRLSNNCITYIPQNESLIPLPRGNGIKSIECENCCIDEIHHQMFYGVLEDLWLPGNNIHKLDMSDLKYLSRFNGSVELIRNKIRNINVTFDYPLTRSRFEKDVFTKIDVGANPVVCDCALLNFMLLVNKKTGDDVNRSSLTFDASNLQCSGPDVRVISMRVLDLSFDQFITKYLDDCPEGCSCHLFCFQNVVNVNCNSGNLYQIPTSYPSIVPKLSLNLTNNQITTLPSKNNSLWQRLAVLNLKNNKLTSLSNLSSRSTITYFNIQDNKLTKLDPELINFITTKTKNTTKLISLSGNPWLCNCDLKQKYDIILNTKHVNITDEKQLSCTFDNTIYNFTNLDEFCFTDSDYTEIIISILVCLIIIIVLAFVITILFFKYKLQIKYCLFTKNLCMWWVSEEDIDADKQYDAFVSYSSLDGEWVNRFLVNGLENEYPFYRLCLHERDWPGGAMIVDQIDRSVERSRRTIIVLTDNFVTSDWGLTEFSVAYQHAIEDNIKRIIVVVPFDLPDLDKCNEEFRSFVKLTTYIEANKPHFWTKLRCSLPRRNNADRDDREDVVARVV